MQISNLKIEINIQKENIFDLHEKAEQMVREHEKELSEVREKNAADLAALAQEKEEKGQASSAVLEAQIASQMEEITSL